MRTYRIVRRYFGDFEPEVLKEGLTLERAKRHCRNPETSSRTCKQEENVLLTRKRGPWFDGYEEET